MRTIAATVVCALALLLATPVAEAGERMTARAWNTWQSASRALIPYEQASEQALSRCEPQAAGPRALVEWARCASPAWRPWRAEARRYASLLQRLAVQMPRGDCRRELAGYSRQAGAHLDAFSKTLGRALVADLEGFRIASAELAASDLATPRRKAAARSACRPDRVTAGEPSR
jgi:hypothetical protein